MVGLLEGRVLVCLIGPLLDRNWAEFSAAGWLRSLAPVAVQESGAGPEAGDNVAKKAPSAAAGAEKAAEGAAEVAAAAGQAIGEGSAAGGQSAGL